MASIWLDVNSEYLISVGTELAEGVKAVENSIVNVLSTPVGSRAFERSYGSRLFALLQQPMDDQTAEDVRVSAIASLERWEPRIVIDTRLTTVSVIRTGNPGYAIKLVYTILDTGTVQTTQIVLEN